MFEQYLAPSCTPDNLDRFIIRSAILQALRDTLPRFSGRLLDVGCGHMPYRALFTGPPSRIEAYIGLDIRSEIYSTRDVEWDGLRMPFADASVDCAMAVEVLEHCPEPEKLLGETRRVLRSGGFIFFTVPFIWPLHDAPFDQYRYTPFALERHLCRAGFDRVELRAFGGWDASFAQMMGLWVRRRPMPRGMRAVLSRFFLPMVWFLARNDRLPDKLETNTMMPGIWGTAVKQGASE